MLLYFLKWHTGELVISTSSTKDTVLWTRWLKENSEVIFTTSFGESVFGIPVSQAQKMPQDIFEGVNFLYSRGKLVCKSPSILIESPACFCTESKDGAVAIMCPGCFTCYSPHRNVKKRHTTMKKYLHCPYVYKCNTSTLQKMCTNAWIDNPYLSSASTLALKKHLRHCLYRDKEQMGINTFHLKMKIREDVAKTNTTKYRLATSILAQRHREQVITCNEIAIEP